MEILNFLHHTANITPLELSYILSAEHLQSDDHVKYHPSLSVKTYQKFMKLRYKYSIDDFIYIRRLARISKKARKIISSTNFYDIVELPNINMVVAKELVSINIDFFQCLPDEFQEDAEILQAVVQRKSNALILDHVPSLRDDREVNLFTSKDSGNFSSVFLHDKQITMPAISRIEEIADELREIFYKDRETLICLVASHGLYRDDDEKYHSDPEISLLSLSGFPHTVNPKFFLDNKVMAIIYLSNYGYRIDRFSERLRDDQEVVLAAVKSIGWTLGPHYTPLAHASKRLQDNREVVLEAVKRDGHALRYASKRLQDDEEIVFEAVKK